MEVKAIANFDQFAKLAGHIPGDLKRQYVYALNKIAARVQFQSTHPVRGATTSVDRVA